MIQILPFLQVVTFLQKIYINKLPTRNQLLTLKLSAKKSYHHVLRGAIHLFSLSAGEDSSPTSIWASSLRRTNQLSSINHRARFESSSDVRRVRSLQVAIATTEITISKLTNFRYTTLLATALSLGLKRAKTAHVPSDLSEVSPRSLRSLNFRTVSLPTLRKVESLRFQPSWCSLLGQKSRRRLNCPTLDSSNVLNLSARISVRLCVSNIYLRHLLGLLFWAKLPVRTFNFTNLR
ncbi:MAG: hypothetical protein ACTS4Z_01245 [Candidatus Hodgkinia cicadicola]